MDRKVAVSLRQTAASAVYWDLNHTAKLQNSQSASRDVHSEPPRHKTELFSNRSRYSVSDLMPSRVQGTSAMFSKVLHQTESNQRIIALMEITESQRAILAAAE